MQQHQYPVPAEVQTDSSDPWIRLIDGSAYHFRKPNPAMLDIHHIATPLSKICRFGGHLRGDAFYSVAEHSVKVANIVFNLARFNFCSTLAEDLQLQFDGLMHDAHEAFVGDVTTPLKHMLGDNFRAIEESVERVISQAFGNTPAKARNPLIKEADIMAYLIERDALIVVERGSDDGVRWPEGWSDVETDIRSAFPAECLPPSAAREAFLALFHSLDAR